MVSSIISIDILIHKSKIGVESSKSGTSFRSEFNRYNSDQSRNRQSNHQFGIINCSFYSYRQQDASLLLSDTRTRKCIHPTTPLVKLSKFHYVHRECRKQSSLSPSGYCCSKEFDCTSDSKYSQVNRFFCFFPC